MPNILGVLKPVNRHMLIIPHFKENKTDTGVLLPDDYKPEEERYIEATVVDISEDCHKQFRHLRYDAVDNHRIIVDKSMIQEVKTNSRKHYMILENYVMGVYRRPDAL